MRDFIVMVGFLGLLPVCMMRPAVGMLIWTWFAIMNPHREAFGFAQNFSFNMIIALVTIGSWFFSRERKMIPLSFGSISMLLWIFWTGISTYHALMPEPSYEFMMFIPIKVFLFAIMLVIMINSQTRLMALMLILCVSIGYYGVRIGLVSILEGGKNLGQSGNFGPFGTMIQDRNHLSLAIIMILPLLHFFYSYARTLIVKRAMLASLLLSILAVLSSYSRGALIALIAMAGYYWWQSRHKLVIMLAGFSLLIPALLFMPPEWYERMNIVDHMKTDESFLNRVAAWEMSVTIADENPITGGGFRVTEQQEMVDEYSDKLEKPLAAHSIYFQVLSEHGYVGLIFFLMMIFAGGLATMRVRHRTRDDPDLTWAYDLAGALQAAYAAFIVGGAALSLAYYDGFYIIIVMSIVLLNLVYEQQKRTNPIETPSFSKRHRALSPA